MVSRMFFLLHNHVPLSNGQIDKARNVCTPWRRFKRLTTKRKHSLMSNERSYVYDSPCHSNICRDRGILREPSIIFTFECQSLTPNNSCIPHASDIYERLNVL